MNQEKVIVTPNPYGGVIEISREGTEDIGSIYLKQGDRYADLSGDLETVMKLPYEANQQLSGHIVTKEQLEPLTEDPLELLKMKDGKVCMKGNRAIYSYNYFTYNMQDTSEIIEEDGYCI